MRRVFFRSPGCRKASKGSPCFAVDARDRLGAAIDGRRDSAAGIAAHWRVAGIYADRFLCIAGVVPAQIVEVIVMLWLKAFHIFFVVSWFAGLFYLPRIFVNHAMAEEQAVRERFKLMERKLYRFVTPIGALAVITGLWMWFGFGFSGGWLHAKTTLVAVLVAYHLYCGHLVKVFAADRNTKSHVWFRFFNEVPVLILLAVVILVVVKPF
jgi:protoporphyrinogen IX oxidase